MNNLQLDEHNEIPSNFLVKTIVNQDIRDFVYCYLIGLISEC